MARPKTALVVTKVDRRVLDSMAHRARTAPQLARRARIVLACATGLDNTTVEEAADVKADGGPLAAAVYRQGRRWAARRTAAGCPSDDQRYAGGSRRLGRWKRHRAARPTGARARWRRPRASVRCVCIASGRLRRTPAAIARRPSSCRLIRCSSTRSATSLNPPQHAAVFCVDEKPQIQALDRTAPLLPLRPGQAERRTHDYKRHGTTSLFAALEVKTGHVLGQIRRRHRAIEFRAFLTALDVQVPADLDVHVIMDNYGTHKTALIRRWFARHPRFHPHFTPTYASWLNLVERWFAALETKQLRRGVHDSVRSLESAIREFIDASNTAGQPYVWTKTADDILASIARFALRTVTVHDRQQVMSRTTGTGH